MSALRKAVKNARIIESVKLTKRVRKARETGGDVDRLELELRRVKELPVDAFVQWLLKRHEDKQEAGTAPVEQDDAGKNVVARLLKARGVVAAVEQESSKTSVHEDEEDEDEPMSNDSESEESEAATSHPKPDRSTFLPTLNTGFLPGSFSDEEGHVEHRGPAQKRPRKNRRGQRARRKILEAKHGRKANHLVKERREKWEAFEQRRLKREAKAEASSAQTGANAIEVSGNRRERREAAKPIHNSWAIAKAAKDAQKAAKPQGHKIVF